MSLFTAVFWTKHIWAGISMLAAAMIVVSSVADKRRQKRNRFDDVGFMPWTAITVLATLATVISAALAVKS